MRLLTLVAMTSAITLAACGNDRNETHAGDTLDAQVCTQGDVGESFNQQTSGDFTPENLAAMGADAVLKAGTFRSLGMVKGHFVYWKDTAGKPPFEPPLDVVCQAMEFVTDDRARAFVADLSPELAAATIVGRLPGRGPQQAAELPVIGGPVRTFSVVGAGEHDGAVTVNIAVAADARYVRLVALGGQDGNAGPSEASALLERVTARRR